MNTTQLQSKHYHSAEKNCDLIKYTQLGRKHIQRNEKVDGLQCKTHHINICHCGWEWTWHGGKDLEKIKDVI